MSDNGCYCTCSMINGQHVDICGMCQCGKACCCKCKCTCDESHHKSYIYSERRHSEINLAIDLNHTGYHGNQLIKDTNATIKLSDCISNSGYDTDNICADHTLNKYQYQSPIVITVTILNILRITFMIWKRVHILLTHFGCLKEEHCNDFNGY